MENSPKLLRFQIAFDIARIILDGFERHYRLFRESNKVVSKHFERMEWSKAQSKSKERISFFAIRINECVRVLKNRYDNSELTDNVWHEVKFHYINLLIDHKQPELAETFFNSVSCNILHRTFFNNNFIFVKPAISTEYIDPSEGIPIYRVFHTDSKNLKNTFKNIIDVFNINCEFLNLDNDLDKVKYCLISLLKDKSEFKNYQIQILSNLFYRNKAAYVVGKIKISNFDFPFVIPIIHNQKGFLYLDTVLTNIRLITILFSFTRAYFMVDMEVPSGYVKFLRSILPNKPDSEIYSVLGLHKQGKAAFYRDFLHHLSHSKDNFEIAPGIEGLVMSVFVLPSFPFVFKVIKDNFPPPKETTPEAVKKKYLLVKYHDRVGRLADTLEYSTVAFPKDRFSYSLYKELKNVANLSIEEENNQIIIKHLYIERRMTPLNIWLTEAEASGNYSSIEHVVKEYGDTIKELLSVNIFPGDMLYKNFGVTDHGRVVFYDYDEIEYVTDCNFRKIPEPRNEEEEMSAEPWYPIAKNDVFPEQFGTFILGNPKIKYFFMKYHADLLTPQFWENCKTRILNGFVEDIFPYPQEIRFIKQADKSFLKKIA